VSICGPDAESIHGGRLMRKKHFSMPNARYLYKVAKYRNWVNAAMKGPRPFICRLLRIMVIKFLWKYIRKIR